MPRVDLYGRTEAEIEAAIKHAERLYAIASSYSGNEGLAINLKRDRASADVDRRILAELRGAKIPAEFRPPPLSGEALRKFRATLTHFYNVRKN